MVVGQFAIGELEDGHQVIVAGSPGVGRSHVGSVGTRGLEGCSEGDRLSLGEFLLGDVAAQFLSLLVPIGNDAAEDDLGLGFSTLAADVHVVGVGLARNEGCVSIELCVQELVRKDNLHETACSYGLGNNHGTGLELGGIAGESHGLDVGSRTAGCTNGAVDDVQSCRRKCAYNLDGSALQIDVGLFACRKLDSELRKHVLEADEHVGSLLGEGVGALGSATEEVTLEVTSIARLIGSHCESHVLVSLAGKRRVVGSIGIDAHSSAIGGEVKLGAGEGTEAIGCQLGIVTIGDEASACLYEYANLDALCDLSLLEIDVGATGLGHIARDVDGSWLGCALKIDVRITTCKGQHGKTHGKERDFFHCFWIKGL